MLKTPSYADLNVTRHTAVLQNGLSVTLFEKPGAPIDIALSFLAGYCFDPIGKEGLAHFTEHMISSGTKKFPTNEILATFIGSLGGGYNASTGMDTLAIAVSIVDEGDFKKAVTLIDEIVNRPLFSTKVIETERTSILQELGAIESTPSEYLPVVGQEIFYQGTLFSRIGIGTKSSIASITKMDMLNFHRQMFTSGRAQMTICGDISMDTVVSVLEKGLKMRKTGPVVKEGSLPVFRDKAIKIKKFTANGQISMNFGFRVCPVFEEDALALVMLSSIFSDGFASSLYRKLRSERGLVYFVSAEYSGGYNHGVFSVATETDKKDLQKVLEIICDEYKRAVSGKITTKELNFFKKQGIKSHKRGMETSGSWVGFHAYGELVGDKKYLTLPEYLKAINKVTVADITRVAKKYFKKDSWYLAVCGDIKEKDIKVNYS